MKIDPNYLKNAWAYSGKPKCPAGTRNYDGYMNTVVCTIKGDYAQCQTCQYNENAANFVEVEERK